MTETVRHGLPRPFDGDRYVDYRKWQVKPGSLALKLVGDLEISENITFEKAKDLLLVVLNDRGYRSFSMFERNFLMNCGLFIVDNLKQLDELDLSQKDETIDLLLRLSKIQ